MGWLNFEYKQGRHSVENDHELCIQFLVPFLARYVTFGKFLILGMIFLKYGLG